MMAAGQRAMSIRPWRRQTRGTALALAFVALSCGLASQARAETPSAPPRTIADIAAILDGEKPDPARIAGQQAKANATVPETADKAALARFYLERAEVRGRLGRVREALADAEQSVELARGNKALQTRSLLLMGQLYGWAGETKKSLAVFRTATQSSDPRRLYNGQRWIGIDLIALGDLDQAETYMQKNRDLLAAAEKESDWATDPFRSSAEAHVAFGDAAIFEARGHFGEAAAAYERAERAFRVSLTKLADMPNPPIRSSVEQVAEWMVARAGRVKAREGRLVEAEIDVRRSLIGWLKLSGKYDLNTARIIDVFTSILVEQGRFAEAEGMARTVIEIYQALGTERDSQVAAISLNRLAGILALQGNWTAAARSYAELDEATKDWEQARKEEIGFDLTRVLTAYHTDEPAAVVAQAERLVARYNERFGERHVETALARGVLGMALARVGRKAEALAAFHSAAPQLIVPAGQASDDDAVAAATREQRIRAVIETYMALLAGGGPDAVAESFRMAEAIRGRSVQKALAASSARAVAGSPDLARLVRTQQDLDKQIGAELGTLNTLLAAPKAERDTKAIGELQSDVAALRAAHDKGAADLARQFPDYAELIAPLPATPAALQSSLRPRETLLSFYFGEDRAFVWAVPQSGRASFAVIPITASELAVKVQKLRQALEPQAALIADIPKLDLQLGYELYALLLKPVEAGWTSSNSLIVVTNGALGFLPLSLLPTAPITLDDTEDVLFSNYRIVPWLARTHAVTMLPSAAALRTLRSLPPGKPGRAELLAFGDPLFSVEEAAEAAKAAPIRVADAAATTRGGPLRRRNAPKIEGVESAELALLPRLPDTADELKSIALALHADPASSLRLGKAANEQAVKTMDLSNFKVVAFATHGLVPGELNGLTQPALALSAPAVAGVEGDGLLTMEEILALKLDADWVVLSACNTGAGAGAGAEAASGLGRAFFYAGTRALLVTNWSVHSQSARELVSDLFRRQADDARLTRGEALRQAMMALVDGPGFLGSDGKPEFAYAHPLFWAPYTIIGDGERR